jgi:hypothetical protein
MPYCNHSPSAPSLSHSTIAERAIAYGEKPGFIENFGWGKKPDF